MIQEVKDTADFALISALSQDKPAQEAISAAETAVEAAETATSAAETATDVLESIPQDYSELSEDVSDLKSDLDDVTEIETITIDKSTGTKIAGYIGSNGVIGLQNNCNFIYFACQPGIAYTISKTLSARFRVGYTAVIPANQVAVSGFIDNSEGTSVNITPEAGAQYLVVYYYDGANDTLTESAIFDSLAITYRGDITAVDKTARSAISEIEPGLSDGAKVALLNCFQHVAWVDEHGQDYYDALESALNGEVPVDLVNIVAVFTQGDDEFYTTDDLDILRDDLVVTAYYSDGTSNVIDNYELSGNLIVGTNTITVSYDGKISSFTVNVISDIKYEINYPSDRRVQIYSGHQGDVSSTSPTVNYFVDFTNSGRSMLALNSGDNSITDANMVSVNRYLLKIPSDATKVKVDIPNSLQVYLSGLTWHTDHFFRRWDSGGWKTTGAICDLSSFVRSDQRYLCININANINTLSNAKITFSTN